MNSASKPRARPISEGDREQISALTDGELAALEDGCRLWRDDADARATWHAYHLIGDVLRSDDLAGTAARDARFLSLVRTRLEAEPVLLAPARRPRRHGWALPAAVAAGFVAVAGVAVVLQIPADSGAPALAVANAPAAPAVMVLPARVERDPTVDRLVSLHRSAVRAGAFAVPGGVPRNYEAVTPVTPVAASVAR
jgi:sigma-E factor negative regulatory protein RseA